MLISRVIKQICLTTAVAVFSTSVAFAADLGQATGNSVNVRAQANTEAEVLGKIDQGDEYTVVGKIGKWFEISFEGQSAFIFDDYFELTEAKGIALESGVNVRQNPSTSSASLGKLNAGDSVDVTGQSGDWYRIAYNDGEAYVSKNFITGDFLTQVVAIAGTSVENAGQEIESTYGVVTAQGGLKLRKEASINSNVLTVLSYGTEVTVDRVGNEWIRVITDSEEKGYVSAEFLSVRKGESTSRSNDSAKGAEIVSYAKQFIGTPYVWAGTNLKTGVDCSGFVYAVMRDFGISLNRSSASMASNGVEISRDQLQSGDLVFFNTGGDSKISHVGIYMGDGNYIHCTDGAAYGVTVTSLNSGYSAKNYVGARRVIR